MDVYTVSIILIYSLCGTLLMLPLEDMKYQPVCVENNFILPCCCQWDKIFSLLGSTNLARYMSVCGQFNWRLSSLLGSANTENCLDVEESRLTHQILLLLASRLLTDAGAQYLVLPTNTKREEDWPRALGVLLLNLFTTELSMWP